jgi:hypothetical protein
VVCQCNGTEAYVIENTAFKWIIQWCLNFLTYQHSVPEEFINFKLHSWYFMCIKGLTMNLSNTIVSIAYLISLLHFYLNSLCVCVRVYDNDMCNLAVFCVCVSAWVQCMIYNFFNNAVSAFNLWILLEHILASAWYDKRLSMWCLTFLRHASTRSSNTRPTKYMRGKE